MVIKVCDRCGCEIKPKNNNPSSIKFGWKDYNGEFTNKFSVDPIDLCDTCIKSLVMFLGCEPERIGVKGSISRLEQQHIEHENEEAMDSFELVDEDRAK